MVSQSLLEPMMTPTSGAFFSSAVKGAQRYLPSRHGSRKIRRFPGGLATFVGFVPLFGFSWVLGCAAPSQERATVLSPGPATQLTPAPALATPLTAEQEALQAELKTHVLRLSHLGERSVNRVWELADAADYVATEWERMGYSIERQGYDVGEVVAQNLEVSVSGSDLGRESIIV